MHSTIDIAKDFSDVPSGRFPQDGDFNGERFREEFLVPRLVKSEIVEVVLDNTEGYGSSFLEEAFGGLVRVHGYSRDFLTQHLHLIARTSPAKRYKQIVEQFISDAHKTSSAKPKGDR
jgi:hypothetical protein